MASWVELEPAPATTGTRPAAVFTHSSTTARCSSWLSVAHSPVGTTGECATLSHDEHRAVVELCVKTAAGRVPVVAGAGSNSTQEAIELVRHAKTVGADAALVVTPYYNRPSQEGLYAHYAAIDAAVQLPVLVYNVPSRTSVDISNDTLARLAKLPNIVGVKDATGDLARASQQRLICGEGWTM